VKLMGERWWVQVDSEASVRVCLLCMTVRAQQLLSATHTAAGRMQSCRAAVCVQNLHSGCDQVGTDVHL
jgi:hypothetical protein